MSSELNANQQKLFELQNPDGSWGWFKGMRPNRYLTQHILIGFKHLEKLGISNSNYHDYNINKALDFLNKQTLSNFTDIEDKEKYKLSNTDIHYLYLSSFYENLDNNKKVLEFYISKAAKNWTKYSFYQQAMIALSFHRLGQTESAEEIMASLKENALINEEMGMYYKYPKGWFWYQAPIESQALIIEAFSEITKDQKSVNLLKKWLLKQKQVQDWGTTKATAEACYALLLQGTDWLANDTMVTVKVGTQKVDNQTAESGTGYIKKTWKPSEITPQTMAAIEVQNPNDQIAWGAMYWQYFEDLNNITNATETPLKLNKKLFLQKDSPSGPVLTPLTDNTPLQQGDQVKIRIELVVDRDMEFIQMKDMRAAGFEPVNVISTHKSQDGLVYYESTKDAATHFFFDWLPKGTYVFEYPLKVTHKGQFSNGITTIQSMYAPEFSSHSKGNSVVME